MPTRSKRIGSEGAGNRPARAGRFADSGVEASLRMHKRHSSSDDPLRGVRVMASLPPENIFVESFVQPAVRPLRALKHTRLQIDAGPVAGVFFGRLNRRFGIAPSRRFSGPSAEFISADRWTAIVKPLFAPMNNPYPRLRRTT